jgi:hypothetical protein
MPKNSELGLEGKGVSALEIPEIEKAISKYQRKKDARCEASPDEIVAKRELQKLLHAHRDELPVSAEGVPFYRSDERDYLLEEKLKIRKVHADDDDEE